MPYLCVRDSLKLDVTKTPPVHFHCVQVVNLAASLTLTDISSHKRSQIRTLLLGWKETRNVFFCFYFALRLNSLVNPRGMSVLT